MYRLLRFGFAVHSSSGSNVSGSGTVIVILLGDASFPVSFAPRKGCLGVPCNDSWYNDLLRNYLLPQMYRDLPFGGRASPPPHFCRPGQGLREREVALPGNHRLMSVAAG